MNTSRFAHTDVWRLAGPMILSNLTVPLLGMVDTAVMGHLGQPYYLGAVAVGSLVFTFVYWAFGFLRMGTTGQIAQAHGRMDHDEVRTALVRALAIAVLLAGVLLAVQVPIHWLAIVLLEASSEVELYMGDYFFVRIWSAPAALMNYVLIGWFLGMQNARATLYMLLLINTVNILLDIWFVLVLDWNVAGVALASVLAEYAGTALGVWLVVRELRLYSGHWNWQAVFERHSLRQMLLLNQNIMIRSLCLISCFAFFTAQGARYGDVILAANAVLMNFQTFMAYALDGFAHAAEALVGKAIGKRDPARFRQAVHTAFVWSVCVALVFIVVYSLFGEFIIGLLTDIDSVRTAATEYLPWLIVTPLISVWGYLFDGIFIGATRSVEMRNTMLVATFLCFIPAWYFLQPFGNHGLWAALMVLMLARGLTMAFSYRRLLQQGSFFAWSAKIG